MSAKILLLINGLGLGNSTRCHAIIQHLLCLGATVRVVTSGNGAWYFRDVDHIGNVEELEPFFYKKKGSSVDTFGTIVSTPTFIAIARRNAKVLKRILDNFEPNAVVTDSVYAFADIKRMGIPLIAINNADVIVQQYFRIPNVPRSIRAQFYAVECMDYLFHRIVPDRVLSPSFDIKLPVPCNKYRRLGGVIRQEYVRTQPSTGNVKRVVIMLSGSTFATKIQLTGQHFPFQVDVIGRDAPPGFVPNGTLNYHGKMLNNHEILHKADLLLVNGGFSAVSEALCMEIPVVVVPVPGHAEQWVNAWTVSSLGVGVAATEHTLEQAMLHAVTHITEFRAGYKNLHLDKDGGKIAAEEILEASGT